MYMLTRICEICRNSTNMKDIVMAKIIITKHTNNKPVWILQLLATLPFSPNVEYPHSTKSEMLNAVIYTVENHTYKRRNTTYKLAKTNIIATTDYDVTISSANHVPQLTIGVTGDDTKPHRAYSEITAEIEYIERKMMDCSAFSPEFDTLAYKHNKLQIELRQAQNPIEKEDKILINKPI